MVCLECVLMGRMTPCSASSLIAALARLPLIYTTVYSQFIIVEVPLWWSLAREDRMRSCCYISWQTLLLATRCAAIVSWLRHIFCSSDTGFQDIGMARHTFDILDSCSPGFLQKEALTWHSMEWKSRGEIPWVCQTARKEWSSCTWGPQLAASRMCSAQHGRREHWSCNTIRSTVLSGQAFHLWMNVQLMQDCD